MSNRHVDVTDIRRRLQAACEELPVKSTKVILGPSNYAPSPELHFLLTAIVGTPSDEAEEVVDALFNAVPDALKEAKGLSCFASRCSGHRLYGTGPDGEPEMGAEWVVKVFT